MRICRIFGWLGATAMLTLSGQPPTAAQQVGNPVQIGWLGLFNDSLDDWLENENRLQALCAGLGNESEAWSRCRAEKLAPRIRLIRLWHGPSEQSRLAGSLLLLATPGQGLRSFFVPTRGGAGTEFRPDLYDADWGYGPYFHETFLERRETWFRLPEVPFPKGTWINAVELGGNPHLEGVEADEIVSSPFGDLVILGVGNAVLRARLEQEGDMSCDGGKPEPLLPWKELRIPVRDLYSPTGHLLIHKKYTRGC